MSEFQCKIQNTKTIKKIKFQLVMSQDQREHSAAHLPRKIQHRWEFNIRFSSTNNSGDNLMFFFNDFTSVLAVQNSSIGDLVTHWLTESLTESRTFTFDIHRATSETCDLCNIWSESLGDMTWPKKYLPTNRPAHLLTYLPPALNLSHIPLQTL